MHLIARSVDAVAERLRGRQRPKAGGADGGAGTGEDPLSAVDCRATPKTDMRLR